MLKIIDTFLNNFTMYKVVLYGLLVLILVSLIFSIVGLLPYQPIPYITSLLLLSSTCFFSNIVFAKLLKVPINVESSLITAFILFFVFDPVYTPNIALSLILAGLIAMASKYVLAINKKHIFNPAAITAFAMGLLGDGNASWWAGSAVLLPVVAIVGFLIVRKTRRFTMVTTFIFTALLAIGVVQVFINKVAIVEALTLAFTSWPLIFFATVMLTEPLTTPPRNNLRIVYAMIVGVLFGAQFEFGPIFSTPELALVIGNIYSFIVSPKYRLQLKLKEKKALASGIYEFSFVPDRKFSFLPGQYLEWTVPLNRPDGRGNRRYFTIASSPTEQDIKLGVKIQNDRSSSFKKYLMEMNSDEIMVASQLAGDFTLPEETGKKLVFIAGGIGVTPFRSMIQNMLDTNEKRDIVFLYTVPHPNELAYRDIFEKAGQALGIRYYYVVTKQENAPKDWTGKIGRISDEMIKEVAPDYKERIFYLSGPNAMVETYKSLLHTLGVPRKNIKSDYFPGF